MGLDTVEANERLGFPADQRNYGVGAQILNDLGVNKFCLITNNPRKIAGLKGYGLEMIDRVPLLIEATSYNMDYLATKAEKLGHLLLRTYLVSVAIQWREPRDEQDVSRSPIAELPISVSERYERLEKIRHLAKDYDLLVQEEARPLAAALFGRASLIFHLGFDQPMVASANWYQKSDHPYVEAIAQILDALADWDAVEQLEFLISSGGDPLVNLQVQLDRQIFRLDKTQNSEAVKPSTVCARLETQRIYVFSSHTPVE
jgi:3,4-dihydroxy 2-butanone 4-phosphate synthase / GTP cyclohydrolase II